MMVKSRSNCRPPLLAEAFEQRVLPSLFTTTTVLSSSANPSSPAQAVTFTSRTTAVDEFGFSVIPPPGGLVEFLVGGKSMTTVPSDFDGRATFQTSSLGSGESSIEVIFYGGSVPTLFGSDFYTRSDASLIQRVEAAPPPTPPVAPPPPAVPSPPPPAAPVPGPAPELPPTIYNRPRLFATGTEAGVPATATLHNPDGSVRFTMQPFGGQFTGGVRVASGDLTGDGIPDLITASGPGGRPEVRVYSGSDGSQVGQFLAFEEQFTGGVFISAADFDQDGRMELVVSPDQGGGPRVRILAGPNAERTLADFLAIDDPNFRGGARSSAGDVNGDQIPDLLIGAGFGGGPRIALFDGLGLSAGRPPEKLFSDFFAFEPELRNGAYVATGDLTGDGFADLVFGGGPGGGPRVLGFDGRLLSNSSGTNKAEVVNRFVADPSLRGGVNVSIGDVNGDGWGDLLVGGGVDGPGVPQTLIGPYFGDPFGFEGFEGLGNGVYVGSEPLPPGTLLPVWPDDPFYIPDYSSAADLAWLLYDDDSWLTDLSDDYLFALLSDPGLPDFFSGGEFYLPEYVGLPMAPSSFGGGFTPTQTSGLFTQPLNRPSGPTISGGGSNPYPVYPAPGGSSSNPQYQRPTSTTSAPPSSSTLNQRPVPTTDNTRTTSSSSIVVGTFRNRSLYVSSHQGFTQSSADLPRQDVTVTLAANGTGTIRVVPFGMSGQGQTFQFRYTVTRSGSAYEVRVTTAQSNGTVEMKVTVAGSGAVGNTSMSGWLSLYSGSRNMNFSFLPETAGNQFIGLTKVS